MKYLRKVWPVFLLALLTACGGASSDSFTPETIATAETAPTWTVGEMQPLYTANSQGYYQITYQERKGESTLYAYNLITRVDYDTMEAEVLCRKPGCEHDNSDCLAYVNPQSSDRFVAQEDGAVLFYHREDGETIKQDALEYFQNVLNDPGLLAEKYPGEAGEAYVQDQIDLLQQPSYVDCISADGLSRERLVSLPEGVNPELVCRDENALYGVVRKGNLDIPTTNYGVRIGLDGQVDTFEIPDPEYTTLMGGWNGKLVLCHTRSPVDMNTMYLYGNYEGFYALEKVATQDCWLYDPATGETEIVRMPEECAKLLNVVGDLLIYCRCEGNRHTLCTYDLSTGKSHTLCEGTNRFDMATPVQNLSGDPHFVIGYLNGRNTMVELSTGLCWEREALGEMTGLTGQGYIVDRPVCETADGRLLLELYPNNSLYPSYTTIPSPITPEENVADARASLQAVQEYAE